MDKRKLSLPQIKSIIVKPSITIAGICYIWGLLIVNKFLANYGIFDVELVKVGYILAGAIFVILAGFPSLIFLPFFMFLKKGKN